MISRQGLQRHPPIFIGDKAESPALRSFSEEGDAIIEIRSKKYEVRMIKNS